MRPRKKKHGEERLAACADILISQPEERRGKLKTCFQNPELPLHVELGCGKGAFILQMAQCYPNINFLALEREKNVLVTATEQALPFALPNLRFILGDALGLRNLFEPGEVERIYINFCDPWHKRKQYKRRLTYRENLRIYLEVLQPKGEIYFKTDNEPLFRFSVGEFDDCMERYFTTENLHQSDCAADNIMTEYETAFTEKGMPIYSIRARKIQ